MPVTNADKKFYEATRRSPRGGYIVVRRGALRMLYSATEILANQDKLRYFGAAGLAVRLADLLRPSGLLNGQCSWVYKPGNKIGNKIGYKTGNDAGNEADNEADN